MQQLTPEGHNIVCDLSMRYGFSTDAVTHMLFAVWDYGAIQPSRIRWFGSVDAGRHDHVGRYVQSWTEG